MKRRRRFTRTSDRLFANLVACSLTALVLQGSGLALQQPRTLQTEPSSQEREETEAKIRDLMAQADRSSDPEERIKLYSQVIALDPNHYLAYERRKEARQEKAARDAARQQAERGQELLREVERLDDLASEQLVAEQFDQAEASVRAALEIHPEDARAQGLLKRIEGARWRARVWWYALWGALGILLLAGIVLLILWLRRRSGVLQILNGPDSGESFGLDQEITRLGALDSEVDFAVHDSSQRISRHHCDVLRNGRHYFLTDLSSNGVFINGERIRPGQPVPLNPGDQIALANEVILRFRYAWGSEKGKRARRQDSAQGWGD